MNKYAIAFDVGGSFIKSVVLNNYDEIIPDSYSIFVAKSKESKDVIIRNMVSAIKQQINRILDKNFEIMGIGFAFPGPFDYENGISYIQGVSKYELLYGVNIKEELFEHLQNDGTLRPFLSSDFSIVFENDASLFALGEYLIGEAKHSNKAMFITLGTGCGSAFIENGILLKQRQDIPPNGWVYNQPFKDSIIDDYISKRGILYLTNEHSIQVKNNEVKNLADMARNGQEQATTVFHQFGVGMGEALLPFVQNFDPEVLILGGQIANSYDLFKNGMNETFHSRVRIQLSKDTSVSTFIGVASLLKQASKLSV